jgi:peptidoglycan/xylan/chitin deacetylase (PgdA/CDA1 family)
MNRGAALSVISSGLIAAWAPAAGAARSGVPVFMYHHVNDTVPKAALALALTFPTEQFERQLRYLAAHKIGTMTAGELVDALSRGHRPERVAVLTFDDGYADEATVVTPLLARYGAHATFFVNAGTIGLRNHVTWRDLRAMRSAGNEIGAHGMYHLDLSTLDRAQQMHEAGDCVARIERFIGFRPVSYAYASGAYNAVTLSVLRSIGIRSAWTEHSGYVHDARDPYEMPRLRISRDTPLQGFASLVS